MSAGNVEHAKPILTAQLNMGGNLPELGPRNDHAASFVGRSRTILSHVIHDVSTSLKDYTGAKAVHYIAFRPGEFDTIDFSAAQSSP
jgi:hypothetical protein